jgi:glycosyltransferase involved in cell wall biosynthesis
MRTRVAGYLAFLWAAFRKVGGLLRMRHFDLIVTASNPPLVGAVGAWYAARYGLPFVYLLHDLHPDSYERSSGRRLAAPVRALWESINRFIFSRCRVIVTVGDGMREYLHETRGIPYQRLVTIHHWAHPELQPLSPSERTRSALGVEEDEALVLYFGNIGLAQNLEWLIEAAEATQGMPIRFAFMGAGQGLPSLRRIVSERHVANVTFLPYLVSGEFEQALSVADLCVVSLKPGLERLAFPSKAYTAMAAGRGLLALMSSDSEVAEIVHRYECGFVAPTQDGLIDLLSEIAGDRTLLSRKGQNARKAYESSFTFDRAVDEYLSLLDGVTGSGDTACRSCHC